MFWANSRIVSYFCVYFLFLCFRFMYIYSFLINEKVKPLFLNNPLFTSTWYQSLIFLGVFSSFFFLLLNGFRYILLFHKRSYHHPKLPRSSTSPPYNQSLQYHKLSSTNYLTWSLQIQSLLEGYDFHHFIDGAHTLPPPTITITGVASPNPTYTTWKCQDRLIFSALLGAISVSLQPLIARTITSLDA